MLSFEDLPLEIQTEIVYDQSESNGCDRKCRLGFHLVCKSWHLLLCAAYRHAQQASCSNDPHRFSTDCGKQQWNVNRDRQLGNWDLSLVPRVPWLLAAEEGGATGNVVYLLPHERALLTAAYKCLPREHSNCEHDHLMLIVEEEMDNVCSPDATTRQPRLAPVLSILNRKPAVPRDAWYAANRLRFDGFLQVRIKQVLSCAYVPFAMVNECLLKECFTKRMQPLPGTASHNYDQHRMLPCSSTTSLDTSADDCGVLCITTPPTEQNDEEEQHSRQQHPGEDHLCKETFGKPWHVILPGIRGTLQPCSYDWSSDFEFLSHSSRQTETKRNTEDTGQTTTILAQDNAANETTCYPHVPVLRLLTKSSNENDEVVDSTGGDPSGGDPSEFVPSIETERRIENNDCSLLWITDSQLMKELERICKDPPVASFPECARLFHMRRCTVERRIVKCLYSFALTAPPSSPSTVYVQILYDKYYHVSLSWMNFQRRFQVLVRIPIIFAQ